MAVCTQLFKTCSAVSASSVHLQISTLSLHTKSVNFSFLLFLTHICFKLIKELSEQRATQVKSDVFVTDYILNVYFYFLQRNQPSLHFHNNNYKMCIIKNSCARNVQWQ